MTTGRINQITIMIPSNSTEVLNEEK